jgi:AcrR family transcriptional regulator
MTGDDEKGSPARKGPSRSEASRVAILDATRVELALNGWRTFSVDAVAKRASASKQTIYRWWPSIGAMCIEAALVLVQRVPDGGRDPQERIAALVQPFENALRNGQGYEILRAALLAAADDAAAGDALKAFIQSDIRQPLRMLMVELATKRLLRRDLDVDEAVEFLLAPLWHRLIVSRAPVKESFAMQQAAQFIRLHSA